MQRFSAPALPSFITTMLPAGVTRYCARVGEQRMHVMEAGSGRPVLLLHGNPTWSFLYRKVAMALAGEPFRLIMPDLIGLGLSDKPTRPDIHTLDAHSRWLGALLDDLDLEDVIFVGHDWGGPIGLHALSTRSDRVTGLVLLNTVVGPPRSGFRPTAFHRLSRVPGISDVLFRLGGFPQNALTWVQGDRLSIAGEVSRAYRYPLRRLRDRVAPLSLARMVPDNHAHGSISPLAECQRFIESYQGPAALVWGMRDPILGRAVGRVARLIPQARVTRTQGGHFLQEEAPNEIAAAIRDVAARGPTTFHLNKS